MRYVLRADASQSIGAGHVMRSSAIAEELIRRGEDVNFVGQISDLPWVMERIASLDFTSVCREVNGFISNPKSDVLILDSYEIDVNDPFISMQKWNKVISIVDEITPEYPCTLMVYPGLDSNWTGDFKTPVLSGPKYIPFRPSIAKNLYIERPESHKLKVSVVAGGSDPYQLVHEIAKALQTIPEEFEATLFTSAILDSTLDSRFHYEKLGLRFDVQTKDADLILTTASTSSFEFLARGLCVGIVCAVDNQKQNYRVMGDLDVAMQIGFRNKENEWQIETGKIHSLITSSELRRRLRANAKEVIDFKGAERIVDAMLCV
jgi:spore coat polysaccharide biosynthesis predicted glycosyltransferase SpsG